LGALRLTTQKFYRVSGESTQYRGIVPDIILPDRQQSSKFGERYLDFSLPWDSIGGVKYLSWNKDVADLDWLRTRSQERVDHNQEFVKIRQVAQSLAERLDKTRQSLNIDIVFKERQEFGKGNGPHDEMGEESAAKNARKTNETDQARLLRLLREDPYAQEAKAVLVDMLSANSLAVKH
jgi:carboxyl-terminal processing protease